MLTTTYHNRPYCMIFHKMVGWRQKEPELLGANIYWFINGSKTDKGVGAIETCLKLIKK